MAVEIITGHTGKEHVTAEAAGALHAGIIGTGKYVLTGGNQFAAEIVSNNLVKIKSGELVNQGRHMRIPENSYEEVTIQNGAQSVKRNDLIVMRYKKESNTLIESVESAELVVIKGTAGSTAADPSYVSGNIFAGATQDDFPLYRVALNGLNIESVIPLFSTVGSLSELEKTISNIQSGLSSVVTASLNTQFSNDSCLQKNGKVVTLNTNISPGFTSKVAEWWGIATLPTGYRPKQNILCTALGYQAGWSDPTVVAGMIGSNGIIYVYSQNSKLTNFSISTSWMVN